MLKKEGTIFDIQRFSVHDGPGIRTTVFLKGCPLKCLWCHNPESHGISPDLAYYESKCASCGACINACDNGCHKMIDGVHSFDRTSCTACGKCATVCPFSALELFGRRESVESVIAEVLRDNDFYKNSGGGVTVSGGEPLMQPDFLIALLKAAKERGLHTCIETSGFASESVIRDVAEYTDMFLFDLKATDEDKHRELTGVPLEPIKRNLYVLDSLGKSIVLRCPLIPDINTDDEHISNIASIASSLENILEVNVMAYHTLGNSKYSAIGKENKLDGKKSMDKSEKEMYIASISKAISEIGKRDIKVC